MNINPPGVTLLSAIVHPFNSPSTCSTVNNMNVAQVANLRFDRYGRCIVWVNLRYIAALADPHVFGKRRIMLN